MANGTDSCASYDSGLDDVIAAYLKAEAQGPAPDRQECLDRHPALTNDLTAFFAEHDRMRAVFAPLAAAASATPPRTPVDTTLPPREADVVTESMQAAATVGATLPASGAPAPPAPDTRVRYFGDYELVQEIARGGMGAVYKARQAKLNRIAALKMILAGQLAGEEDVKRFYTEAEAAAKLDHPGIVPIYAGGQHAGQHLFSMGYPLLVAGTALRFRIGLIWVITGLSVAADLGLVLDAYWYRPRLATTVHDAISFVLGLGIIGLIQHLIFRHIRRSDEPADTLVRLISPARVRTREAP